MVCCSPVPLDRAVIGANRQGREPREPREPKKQLQEEVVGSVVKERFRTRVGRDNYCHQFARGTCNRTVDPKTGGCKVGKTILIHKCSVVTGLDPLTLCGGNHVGTSCPHFKK